MVKAYFENKHYSELVAIFQDEETYETCLPALEKLAKKHNFNMVTESVVERLIVINSTVNSTRLQSITFNQIN